MSLRLITKTRKIIRNYIVYLTIAGLLLPIGAGMVYFSVLGPYSSGWEVQTSIDHAVVDGKTFYLNDVRNLPDHGSCGAKSWQVDFDKYPDDGMPDVKLVVQNPIHVSPIDWHKTPDEESVKTKTVVADNGKTKYVFDLHYFMFNVYFRTIVDDSDFGGPYWSLGASWWDYERTPISQVWENDNDGVQGRPFKGEFFIRFKIKPWAIRSSEGNYSLSGVWAGVMGAYVVPGTSYARMIETPSGEWVGGYIKGIPGDNQPLNMFYVDGEEAERINWNDVAVLDPDIPNEILIELHFEAQIGLKLVRGITNAVEKLYALNYEAGFKVYVQVLTTHKFVLASSDVGENMGGDVDVQNMTGTNFWDNVGAALGDFAMWVGGALGAISPFIYVLIIIVIIAAVLIAKSLASAIAARFRGQSGGGGSGGGGGGIQQVINIGMPFMSQQRRPRPVMQRQKKSSFGALPYVLVGIFIIFGTAFLTQQGYSLGAYTGHYVTISGFEVDPNWIVAIGVMICVTVLMKIHGMRKRVSIQQDGHAERSGGFFDHGLTGTAQREVQRETQPGGILNGLRRPPLPFIRREQVEDLRQQQQQDQRGRREWNLKKYLIPLFALLGFIPIMYISSILSYSTRNVYVGYSIISFYVFLLTLFSRRVRLLLRRTFGGERARGTRRGFGGFVHNLYRTFRNNAVLVFFIGGLATFAGIYLLAIDNIIGAIVLVSGFIILLFGYLRLVRIIIQPILSLILGISVAVMQAFLLLRFNIVSFAYAVIFGIVMSSVFILIGIFMMPSYEQRLARRRVPANWMTELAHAEDLLEPER